MMWWLLGVFVGVVNAVSLIRMVACLSPTASARGVLGRMQSGFLLRLVLVVLALSLALRQGIGPGLQVFGGLWLTRWAVVGLAHANRIPWRALGS